MNGSSVSVVIPTFNRAALLEITLASVLAQSVAADEIIVVDDGSTDDTAAVCARQPATVSCIRQDNRGLSAARNRGIQAAKGDWVALCDSDDLWHPKKLERQLAILESTGASWSVTGCTLIDPSGESLATEGVGFERVFPVLAERRISADQLFRDWLRPVAVDAEGHRVVGYAGDAFGLLFEGNVVLPSSAIFARKLVDTVGLFDEDLRAAEETEFFHRLAAHASLAVVMDALVEYRVGHPSIISNTNAERLIQTALESGERAAKLRGGLSAKETRAYADGRRRLLARLAYDRLSKFDRRGARSAALMSLRQGASRRAMAILAASTLPEAGLRLLHSAKRKLK